MLFNYTALWCKHLVIDDIVRLESVYVWERLLGKARLGTIVRN